MQKKLTLKIRTQNNIPATCFCEEVSLLRGLACCEARSKRSNPAQPRLCEKVRRSNPHTPPSLRGVYDEAIQHFIGNNLLPVVLCMLTISILNSCRTTKDVSVTDRSLGLKTEASFFAAYNDKAFQYNTLSAHIQFDIVLSGNEMSSRGQLRMMKDERIQIFIQPLLGIDVIRAELTPDSIKIVNRLNRWYMIDAFDHIKGNTEIDFNFYNLQALITNRLFLPGEINLTDDKFNLFGWEQTHTGYLLQTSDRNGLQYAFTADSNEQIITTVIKDDATHYMLDCSYKNFLPAGHQSFPTNLHIRLHTESKEQYSLALSFSRVEVDTPLTINFPIPTNYQRVSLSQIINSINNL